ncbi:na+/H+ exchanger NHE3 [Cardiosporidium cionae]|uniref:Na+/H+ exchanger NHE3 n=1 Tax=Cardiosporidium cionae TaxID=476202 RepID=A0ABQ7J548_9APIC|nr:na+/H+ exchanger NHE3 [Cardiosporidium cionae]|eukprot:KAF8819122.1 na+/H+ exchanger NHE3 [Cardiosporidium cionae]
MSYSLLFFSVFTVFYPCFLLFTFGAQDELATVTRDVRSLPEKSIELPISQLLPRGTLEVGALAVGGDVEPTKPAILSNSTVTDSATGDESLDKLPSSEKEILLSTGVLLLLLMLGVILVITHCLQIWNIQLLQMPVCATVLGILVGAIFKLGVHSNKTILTQILALNEDVFFIFLLPPIIFEGGISITRDELGDHFFANFGTILWYAIFCTLVSFCFIGGLIHFCGLLHLFTPLTLRESFSFGALISSTDPVSVLSMFKHLPPNPTFHALIVGESLFNDAISIVLYKTIVTEGSSGLGMIITSFLFTFFFSVIIGVGIGLISAFVYKKVDLNRSENAANEVALMFLFAWGAYSVAESYSFSGIVSICFCGITMGKYASPNLSEAAQAATETLFSMTALLAETVVFLFLGLAVFSFHHGGSASLHFSIFWIVSVGRCISVYLTSILVNLWRDDKISPNFQHALVICGLRGAIAFALSQRAKHDFGGSAGVALLSITLFYSLFSIIVVGCTLKWILQRLGIFQLSPSSTHHPAIEREEKQYAYGTIKMLLLRIDNE